MRRTRRVGDQNDRAAGGLKPLQSFTGLGIAIDPIVDDAPNVAKKDVVLACDFSQTGNQNRGGGRASKCLFRR